MFNFIQTSFENLNKWINSSTGNYNMILMILLFLFFVSTLLFAYAAVRKKINVIQLLFITLFASLVIDTPFLKDPEMHLFILFKYVIVFIIGAFLALIIQLLNP
ncbi:hypothetical protein CHT97_12680 [Lacticaseibacillus chiayiensis]|nr:hypothetical protein CHT97_12680 [Lacticaseibacillus chiayiensis]